MSKLITSFTALTIVSGISKTAYDKAKQFAPTSVTLFDEKRNPVFAMSHTKAGSGNVTPYGVSFDSTDANGNLCLTINDPLLPAETDKKKAQVTEKYATALFNLNQIEAQVMSANTALQAQIDAVSDSIIIG